MEHKPQFGVFYSYLCNETTLWYLCFTHRTVGSFSSKLQMPLLTNTFWIKQVDKFHYAKPN